MVEVKDISFAYAKGGHEILDGISFDVPGGICTAILGNNGAGKSTLLKCIDRILRPKTGSVVVDGKDVFAMSGNEMAQNVAYVAQNAHAVDMTVFDTVLLGRKPYIQWDATQKDRSIVADILHRMKLEDYALRNVSELSGGEAQKVLIARALAQEPRVLLLDEPLGALDLKLRKDMQIELKRIQQRTGITFIYVTHDQEEALTMSDRVVVMNHGVIQQVGSPTDIYNEPVNAFVADFIGESNIIDGVMLEDCKVEFCGRTFECVDKGFEKNAPVDVVIRPEDLKIVYAGDGLLQGVVESIVFKGVHYEMMVRTQFFTFMVHSTMAESVGKTVGLSVIPFDIHIMHKSAEAQA